MSEYEAEQIMFARIPNDALVTQRAEVQRHLYAARELQMATIGAWLASTWAALLGRLAGLEARSAHPQH